ncbi:MAG: aldo/keto reductase [Planctomycetaceae bacterium]|nr:aldo/keto reductase [Planctomycetaceae bacterium]
MIMQRGFGLGRLHHLASQAARERVVHAALVAGFRHFDVAPTYGDGMTECEIGRIVGSRRHEISITTKFGIPFRPIGELPTSLYLGIRAAGKICRTSFGANYRQRDFSPRALVSSLEQSLRRLRKDYIDCFLIHEPLALDEFSRLESTWEELRRQQARGTILRFGVSGDAETVVAADRDGYIPADAVRMIPLGDLACSLPVEWYERRDVFVFNIVKHLRRVLGEGRFDTHFLVEQVRNAVPRAWPIFATNRVDEIERLGTVLAERQPTSSGILCEPASTMHQSPASLRDPVECDRDNVFDVCIIGAGAAGLVLAELLSADPSHPMRICLLEAGPERFHDRKEPFSVHSLMKEHLGVNEGRVTAFGGATNTWGGGLIRLSEADFDPLVGRPDTAWPMSYASMIPHYEAVEWLFGFSPMGEGPENIFFEDIIDTAALRVRRREVPVLPFRGKNFGQRFGPRLRLRSNVKILCNASIARIHSGASGISHLDVTVKGASPIRIVARRFVIAAGIVNSTLLARRVLVASGLTNEVAKVGKYFHDHLSLAIARLHPRSQWEFSRRFGYKFERGVMLGEHFDIETVGERWPGAFLHLAFDMSTSSVLRPVRLILNAIQRRSVFCNVGLTLRDIPGMVIGLPRLAIMRYLFGRLYLDSGTRILAMLDLEQIPEESWRLDWCDDVSTVGWDASPADSAIACAYMPTCIRILDKLRVESHFEVEMLVPDPATNPAGFVAEFRREAKDTFHSAGGLRMGLAADALVDSELRLRGVANTHVLSAAVFPRIGTSNPTLTILALGHRLAEFLKNEPGCLRTPHASASD